VGGTERGTNLFLRYCSVLGVEIMGNRRPGRQGFLLVTVVVLLAIVTVMLARLSMWSMREAASSLEAERQLRQRWAATSMQAHCLRSPRSLAWFASEATDEAEIQPHIFTTQIQLGGDRWRVVVSDESAKVNMNKLIAERPADEVQQLVHELLGPTAPIELKPIAERPMSDSGGSKRLERWFHCPTSQNQARAFAAGASKITLWGDGRLNIYRASDSTLDALWRRLFGRAAPSELHAMRRSTPGLSWDQIASRLALREAQREVASRWFTTRSHTTSVWLLSETDRRIPAHLYVRWGTSAPGGERLGFIYD
jgi:hypothetical protein